MPMYVSLYMLHHHIEEVKVTFAVSLQDWMRTNTICQGEIADNLDPDVQQNCEGSTFLHYVTNK